MYGLPKTLKPDTPIQPISAAIGNTPYEIARAITKILTPLRRIITPPHIKNLLIKSKKNDVKESFYKISLYTNN